MSKRVSGLVLCSLSLLVTSSCSTGSSESTSDSRKTVIITMTSQPPAETEQTVDENNPAPADPAQTKSQIQNSGKVGGNCGVSAEGDEIRAYSATSCDFAWAIYDQALTLTYYTSNKQPSANLIEIASPTTGQSYPIRCWIGSSGTTLICGQEGTSNTVGAQFEHAGNSFAAPKWYDRLNIIRS